MASSKRVFDFRIIFVVQLPSFNFSNQAIDDHSFCWHRIWNMKWHIENRPRNTFLSYRRVTAIDWKWQDRPKDNSIRLAEDEEKFRPLLAIRKILVDLLWIDNWSRCARDMKRMKTLACDRKNMKRKTVNEIDLKLLQLNMVLMPNGFVDFGFTHGYSSIEWCIVRTPSTDSSLTHSDRVEANRLQ